MKTFPMVLLLALCTFVRASAQVTVEVTMERDQFLPSEGVPVAVRVTNRSGQPLHLGAAADWLTFSVESADGFIVLKNAEVPVLGEFNVGSSQVAIKRVDLAPYFGLGRPGRYHVIATVKIKDWNAQVSSPGKYFDVMSGAELWTQDFGVPVPAGATNQAPEVRKYTLMKVSYVRSQMSLYVQVGDQAGSRVYKIIPVGKMVSFSQPETQVDRASNLHVLWQNGAQAFTYAVVNPSGDLLKQEIYDYVSARPRLAVDEGGAVTVLGGMRRIKTTEVPLLKSPDEVMQAQPAKP
jgi:hypothetical protein